jgi:hypothetical protein
VVLDFKAIRAATQSFVHACMYKILRDRPEASFALSIAGASDATREAILLSLRMQGIAGRRPGFESLLLHFVFLE